MVLSCALVALGGCGDPSIDDPRRGPLPVACPAALPAVGAPGTTTLETREIVWASSDGAVSHLDDYVYLGIPDDLVGLVIAVEDGRRETGFLRVVQGGESIVDVADDGLRGTVPPFFHAPLPVGSLGFPMSAGTSLAAGCLAVDPFVLRDSVGRAARLHVVSRRLPPGGRMALQVVLVADTLLSPEDLDAVVATMSRIYEAAGAPGIAEVSVHTLPWRRSVIGLGRESDELRAAFAEGRPGALPIFVAQGFTEVDTLGVAAGTPGPNGVPATASSGVMLSVDAHLLADGLTLDVDLLGETLAHEAGHQLGLFHTSEDRGDLHDGLADTPRCLPEDDADRDGTLSAEECAHLDGDNLMFWGIAEGFAQERLSAEQVLVLAAGPLPVPAP